MTDCNSISVPRNNAHISAAWGAMDGQGNGLSDHMGQAMGNFTNYNEHDAYLCGSGQSSY
jgi:hypothetical protein